MLIAIKNALFQPTLPARGATPDCTSGQRRPPISTHAPRTGSDTRLTRAGSGPSHFNPRSPHGERHQAGHARNGGKQYFNPRSPHGERRHASGTAAESADFNPRSPHGERHHERSFMDGSRYFNPRSPHGERREMLDAMDIRTKISTHAPRTGSDTPQLGGITMTTDFNPRSPHGERPERTGK